MPIVTSDSNVTPELLAIAANASYSNYPTLPTDLKLAGYELLRDSVTDKPVYINDLDTGFVATVWHNEEENEYIVSLRGTDVGTAQDWYTNLQLGEPQFNSDSGGVLLKNQIDKFNIDASIHFTGHSLGGGLAQYFAYEYASHARSYDISLTTSMGSESLIFHP